MKRCGFCVFVVFLTIFSSRICPPALSHATNHHADYLPQASSTRYTSDDVSSFEAALQAALEKAQTSLNEIRDKSRSEVR